MANFIVGLPGETQATIRNTIDFAKRLDAETIQLSIAHALPGTERYDLWRNRNGQSNDGRRRRPSVAEYHYLGLDKAELLDAVERFYANTISFMV